MSLVLTVDEIVETLKRSSLTTVIVEGKDDLLVYRWIEDEIGIHRANFLPCGGRDKLLQVFGRRSEFSQIKTIFIADKDAYLYTSIPSNLEEIIWTSGYSIENDLYEGKKIEGLLDTSELVKFQKAIDNYITYYAFEVEQCQKKLVYNFSNHPNQVLCEHHELIQSYLAEVNFKEPKQETINKIKAEYDLLIRGKSIFALLLRFLSSKKRPVKHSKKALMEQCYKSHRSNSMNIIIGELNGRLSA